MKSRAADADDAHGQPDDMNSTVPVMLVMCKPKQELGS